MAVDVTTKCPGCGLELPAGKGVYEGYYHVTRECWSVYTEVLAAEYGDAPLFGRIHQLTVDAYALQHTGGDHKPKSVTVHLVGLHLQLEQGVPSFEVPPRLQALVKATTEWPTFETPPDVGPLTVFDVALAVTTLEHEERVRAWARQVWDAWRPEHERVAALAAR